MNTGRALLVRVDGELLAEEEARAMWSRFSEHMESSKGDLAGFAVKEGFASVHPGIEGGRPVLVLSRTAPQKAYAPVPSSGSGPPRPGAAPPARGAAASGNRPDDKPGKKGGKRRP